MTSLTPLLSRFRLLTAAGLTALALPSASAAGLAYETQQLSNEFWSEGVACADFNKDGKLDILAGPYWWEGPDFKVRHAYDATDERKSPGGVAPFEKQDAEGKTVKVPGFEGGLGVKNAYSDNFLSFAGDFNGDGWSDVLVIGFPGEPAYWHENPKGKDEPWPKHLVVQHADNESPNFLDINGDKVPELVFHTRLEEEGGKAYLGYATFDKKKPDQPWTFHKISPAGPYERFTHGCGAGDVNGDGRVDFLEKNGWWEQPASLKGDPEWKFHPADFGKDKGGAQMYAYDFNGDGKNDVLTSLDAHGYGLAWFEQVKGDNGGIAFKQHLIVNREASENPDGVKFAQIHAIELHDMDGDGVKDIVAGKRFWAHGPTGDVEPSAPPYVYCFLTKRGPGNTVKFEPVLISDQSGVGTQFVITDVNKDGLPDVVTANKKGVFFHKAVKKP